MTPRRLDWTPEALANLAELAAYSPVAARRAVDAIEAMAGRGFNYGIRLSGPWPRWYWPEVPIGLYYTDDGHTLSVFRVVDARRLRELPR